jgi:hypothetical protein
VPVRYFFFSFFFFNADEGLGKLGFMWCGTFDLMLSLVLVPTRI